MAARKDYGGTSIRVYTEKGPDHDETNPLSYTVIFLHREENSAGEFATDLLNAQASDGQTLRQIFPDFKWVFPEAEYRYSKRFETDIRQWFDVWSSEEAECHHRDLPRDGLKESVHAVWKVIHEEAERVGMERIILAGISQGCATAIHALLAGDVEFAGFIGLSGWLPFRREIQQYSDCRRSGKWDLVRALRQLPAPEGYDLGYREQLSEQPLHTPMFLGHCQDDEVVSISEGETLAETLQSFGVNCTTLAYPDGGHWVNEPRGVDDIVAFVHKMMLARIRRELGEASAPLS